MVLALLPLLILLGCYRRLPGMDVAGAAAGAAAAAAAADDDDVLL